MVYEYLPYLAVDVLKCESEEQRKHLGFSDFICLFCLFPLKESLPSLTSDLKGLNFFSVSNEDPEFPVFTVVSPNLVENLKSLALNLFWFSDIFIENISVNSARGIGSSQSSPSFPTM